MCVHSNSKYSGANISDTISQQVMSVEGIPECKYLDMEEILNFNPENYDLKLKHLNICSLLSKQGNLIELLTDLRRNKLDIDILMLCETYSNKSTMKFLGISGYDIANRKRLNKKNEGMAILIKDHLKSKNKMIYQCSRRVNLRVFLWNWKLIKTQV